MDYINVYEPFIEEYRRRIYGRSKILKEIGTRSGILPAEFLDNNQKISRVNAKLVIDWISTSLKIELAFPEESELELELNDKVPEKECELELEPTNKVPHNSFYNLIGVVSLLMLISTPLPPMFLHFYQQLVEQPVLTSDDTLLKQQPKK